MFQSDGINALFNCKLCKDVLVDPVILPCGETVCKAHTGEISQDKCILCPEIHRAPQNGFPTNKIVTNLLEHKANKINLSFSQFNDYNKIIQDLNYNLKEIETIRKDPDNYICEYFGELTRQVDLRRETIIENIHKYSDEIIQNIEKLKQDCVAKSKGAMVTSEDMISQKKSKEMSDLMGPVLKQFKFELQGKKYYKLITNKIKMENIFGSLGCFDFNIENMKVNISYQLLFL